MYPIIDLHYFFMDIHKYIRSLEEVIIKSLWNGYKINGIRLNGKTGVWISTNEKIKIFKKICSIGIKVSRWITMHGLALNINTNLKYFDYIIPCGINNIKMTSLRKELKYNKINNNKLFYEVKKLVKKSFQEIFDIDYIHL
nr:lipoyl(octanoyl) transferase LipB [Blattabacterium cuenoti]